MNRLPTLIALALLNAGAFWLWYEFSREQGVADVAGKVISVPQFREALRQHLFRRGIDWQTCSDDQKATHRKAVLDAMADGLRLSRVSGSVLADVRSGKVDSEFQDFIAEFDPETEYGRRLALQQETEPQLLERIAMRQHEETWLEGKLAQISLRGVPDKLETQAAEVWRVRQLFLSAFEVGKPDRLAEIEAYYQKITSGVAGLEELISLYSEDARTKGLGGDLGWFSDRRMPAEFMAEVKKAAPGKVSVPFKTKIGWHIIELIDHKPAHRLSTSEMALEQRAIVELEARSQALKAILEDLRTVEGAEITLNPRIPLDSLEPL
ncbi:MAG: peptidylprolyl isomerase [Verrucomicrobiaceae bacterium]|nr:peptidylprolyl isomerase [Verrucomicrobiaceae bacterium]